jgi:hypothetical protein
VLIYHSVKGGGVWPGKETMGGSPGCPDLQSGSELHIGRPTTRHPHEAPTRTALVQMMPGDRPGIHMPHIDALGGGLNRGAEIGSALGASCCARYRLPQAPPPSPGNGPIGGTIPEHPNQAPIMYDWNTFDA